MGQKPNESLECFESNGTRVDLFRSYFDPSRSGQRKKDSDCHEIIIHNPHARPHHVSFNPAGAGPPRHPPAAGGGHKVAPLYLREDIVATRKDRETKLCAHLPDYLGDVVFKFGVNTSM